MKIIIIGGGISGLTNAFVLCQSKDIEIELYEQEDFLGGQAGSKKGKFSYIEYCWRVISSTHTNLYNICFYLGIKKEEFTPFNPIGFTDKDKCHHLINTGDMFACSWKVFKKYFDLKCLFKTLYILSLSKERVIDNYKNISCTDYTNHHPIFKTLVGPIWGTEPRKASLSSVVQNTYALLDYKNRNRRSSHGGTVTTRPTQFIIKQWEEYLISRGVKIHINSKCSSINYNNINKTIESLTINDKLVKGNHFIFACSLQPLNNLIKKTPLYNLPTFQNMIKLENCLQLYFAFNIYFNKPLNYLNEFLILVDMPWHPTIQRKIRWNKDIMNCHSDKIKEVWNVGVCDFYPGKYVNKILRECSIEEAIFETLNQINSNKYIYNELRRNNTTFKEIFIGTEYWPQYYNRNGKVWTHNPKFSPNAGYDKYIPTTSHPPDIPKNMSLSAYYVKSSWGGATMESSCEIGVKCANEICYKYKIPSRTELFENATQNSILPFPLDKLNTIDKTLYKLKLPNVIIFFAFIIIVLVIIGVMFGLTKRKTKFNYSPKSVELSDSSDGD